LALQPHVMCVDTLVRIGTLLLHVGKSLPHFLSNFSEFVLEALFNRDD